MVTPSQMLPPNSTALERAIADTAPRRVLNALADAPRRLKSDPPDAVVPWLASEWFLADFIGYFADAKELLAAGLPWLHERGTAAAVKRALGWIGLTVTLEEDGARLQIDPGTIIDHDRLTAVIHLVNASIPAHVGFYRMYHGYDLRPLRLDASRLGDALLDDDSGVWRDGVKLSFGTRTAAVLSGADDPLRSSLTRIYSTRVWEDNSWRLDAWSLDSEILIDAASGSVSQQSVALAGDVDGMVAHGYQRAAAVTLAADTGPALSAMQIALRSATLADPIRRWTGPWTGPWREVIPSRIVFEVE